MQRRIHRAVLSEDQLVTLILIASPAPLTFAEVAVKRVPPPHGTQQRREQLKRESAEFDLYSACMAYFFSSLFPRPPVTPSTWYPV